MLVGSEVNLLPMAFPIQIEDVWKTFGARTVIRGLSLSVPSGSVYGFLGPNGAGKSTTIRMILGLQRPSSGIISLFGRSLAAEPTALLGRIGSLVETPSLYLHLTGRENLEIHRRLLGATKQSIDEALGLVALTTVADRPVRKYSSGMKQRLGLAQALLGNPQLLVLDEPTNGLDPAGIQELRSLIRNLPTRAGVTVFLSSHLLSEIQQVATHLAIISQGLLKFEGTLEQLQSNNQQSIVLEVDQLERTTSVLTGLGLNAILEGNRITVARNRQYEPSQINSLLVHAGIAVSHVSVQSLTLEDLFLELTRSVAPTEEHSPDEIVASPIV
jgi:lantibiotic transport system ATP-binding protein